MGKEKIEKMEKARELEEIILALEYWVEGEKLDEHIEYLVGTVKDYKQRDEKIKFHKESLNAILTNKREDNKLYLSEIVKKEEIEFKSNNLILSPVGSGKTTLIKDLLEDYTGKALLLVSNTTLKNSISPDDYKLKAERADRTFTTQNKIIYGPQKYNIHVMSYAEFGKRVRINDKFIEDIDKIFCDEIHSLPNYQLFDKSANLSHAIKTLFSKHENKQIFYFTATDEYLIDLESREPEVFEHVTRFDFRRHPEIKQYTPLSEYKFNHIEQIRPHLRARLRTFSYFGYKSLAFSRTISGQKRIAEIAEEEGFVPLVLWSINNKSEDLKMSSEQLKARSVILNTGIIPSPYNILIINSAMQEGWNLYDPNVKLAIMNTISETEKTQALGRLRHDIDVLTYKVQGTGDVYGDIVVPNKYLGVPLDKERKDMLCSELNILNSNGNLSKWRAISTMLNDKGSIYTVKDFTKVINGKRTRVSEIYLKEDID